MAQNTTNPAPHAGEKDPSGVHDRHPTPPFTDGAEEGKDATSTASKPQGTLQDQIKTMEGEGQAQPQSDELPVRKIRLAILGSRLHTPWHPAVAASASPSLRRCLEAQPWNLVCGVVRALAASSLARFPSFSESKLPTFGLELCSSVTSAYARGDNEFTGKIKKVTIA